MMNGLDEEVYIDQAIRNLHFLIRLALQKTETSGEGHEDEQAHTALRRLIDLEEIVRKQQLAAIAVRALWCEAAA